MKLMKVRYIHKSCYRNSDMKLVPNEIYELPEHIVNEMPERFQVIETKQNKPMPEVTNGD